MVLHLHAHAYQQNVSPKSFKRVRKDFLLLELTGHPAQLILLNKPTALN